MKKISIIGFVLICFVLSSHAQSWYSMQNLEQASNEDLNYYLKQAKKQRTTGIILTTVGPVTYGTLLIFANTEGSNMDLDTAAGLFLLGSISTIVGIPMLIIGSSRGNRVKNVLSKRVSIDMAPFVFQNNFALAHQSGITLRIRF